MTPDAHGYHECYRCRVLRPRAELTERVPGTPLYHCTDDAVCSRLADVGAGRLDADTGAEVTR